MDHFTKCNPTPTSCILCLLHFYQNIMSCTNIIGDRRMVNCHFFHSPFSLHCIIAALAFADVADPPARSLWGENTKRSFFSLFSPFHVKTAQLPTIDKCKEQHQAGSEGEGGSLGIRLSCRYCCVPSKIGGMTTTLWLENCRDEENRLSVGKCQYG